MGFHVNRIVLYLQDIISLDLLPNFLRSEYNLPYIWDGVQINTPELKIKHQQKDPECLPMQPTSLAPPRTYLADNSYIPTDLNMLASKSNKSWSCK